jgi:hypothetical protein
MNGFSGTASRQFSTPATKQSKRNLNQDSFSMAAPLDASGSLAPLLGGGGPGGEMKPQILLEFVFLRIMSFFGI